MTMTPKTAIQSFISFNKMLQLLEEYIYNM